MSLDTSLTHSFNQALVHHDDLADPAAWFASASAKLFVLALLVMLVVPRTRKPAIVAAMATPIALGFGAILAKLVTHVRPFAATDSIHRFIAHAADNGFPSDHATASFAIATGVFLSDRRVGGALLAAATVLGVCRVATGVHYPSDILAGAAVGVLGALVSARLWVRVAPHVEPLLERLTARLPAPVR